MLQVCSRYQHNLLVNPINTRHSTCTSYQHNLLTHPVNSPSGCTVIGLLGFDPQQPPPLHGIFHVNNMLEKPSLDQVHGLAGFALHPLGVDLTDSNGNPHSRGRGYLCQLVGS